MTSRSTPSIRYRMRRSRSMGSMWMSEARSVMAWVIRRFTILTMGPSSTAAAACSSSLRSCSAVAEASEAICWTDSSIRLYLRMAPSMSAAVATTGCTSMPVIVRMSSRANRLAGSAMATRSLLSS